METDKVDKSAVGFEYQGKTEKHESQKGLWCGERPQATPFYSTSPKRTALCLGVKLCGGACVYESEVVSKMIAFFF